MLSQGYADAVRDRCVGQEGDVGQRVPVLTYGRDALIRDIRADQPDVGQQVTILNQGCIALIRDHCVGHKGVGRRVPMLNQGCAVLVRDRCVGQEVDVGLRVPVLTYGRDRVHGGPEPRSPGIPGPPVTVRRLDVLSGQWPGLARGESRQ